MGSDAICEPEGTQGGRAVVALCCGMVVPQGPSDIVIPTPLHRTILCVSVSLCLHVAGPKAADKGGWTRGSRQRAARVGELRQGSGNRGY